MINSALLDIFDFPSRNIVLSEETMNLDDRMVEKYVRAQIVKCFQDIRCQDGYFHEESTFLNTLKSYTRLPSFSSELAETFITPYKDQIDTSFDVLYVDFQCDDIPYIGMFFLESQRAITHHTQISDQLYNTVVPSTCVLPSTSKKLNTFAIINRINYNIKYCDVKQWPESVPDFLQKQILDCTSEKSKKEILQDVQAIVEEVAEQSEENNTVVLSKFKNYVKENSEISDTLSFDSIAEHVFPESKALQDSFHAKAIEKELPKEVELPPQSVQRTMKNQRIKTDTGIELSFPTTYFQSPEYIEFINKPDGTISIEIKNIGKIIPKG